MIANFLMHLKDFEEDTTELDVVMAKTRHSACVVGICYKQLLEWGNLLEKGTVGSTLSKAASYEFFAASQYYLQNAKVVGRNL